MDEKRLGAHKHQLSLIERESLDVDGVLHVESFDDREIVLETELGLLIIRGEDLHINELNLESASLSLQGYIKVLEYAGDAAGRRKGFWAKLFR